MERMVTLRCLAFAALTLATTVTLAQTLPWAETYGAGVHAYYSGDLEVAHKLLTEAIERGSRDPRPFYFRGLASLRRGQPQAARDDFRRGAMLELFGSADAGFQAYFSGDLVKAHTLLTDEVVAGTDDPHIFYVRGLTYEKLRRTDEAQADFQRAVELGFRGLQPAAFETQRDLQRIQGQLRLQLENARRQVRLRSRTDSWKQPAEIPSQNPNSESR